MKIRELIDELEKLYQEDIIHEGFMGEPEINIDVFRETENGREYAGIHTGKIRITTSADGVYRILSAFAEDYEKPE